jgi:hypothetical protein
VEIWLMSQVGRLGSAGLMRYGHGGQVDQVEHARRLQVRRRAAQPFAQGRSAVEVTGLLRLSTKSAASITAVWQVMRRQRDRPHPTWMESVTHRASTGVTPTRTGLLQPD